MSKLITTECVSYGYPDKVADQISDAILDAYLAQDKDAKIAVETMVKDQIVVLGGEVTSKAVVDIDKVIRETVKDIGFTKEQGFYWEDVKIINLIGKQSPEINHAVVGGGEELGAGDQGFMVGYAINDTPNAMPVGMYVARKLCDYVVKVKGLGKDVKSQITIEEFDSNKKRIHTILVSTMHDVRKYNLDELTNFLKESILANKMELSKEVFSLIDDKTKIFINPAGSWEIGGPVADCGVTGRKIISDQYGANCNVGGGAFCFEENTLIKTEKGFKKIKDIKISELVWTINETTNKLELKPVLKIYEKTAEDSYDLLEVELESGEIIKITENHEVKTKKGWIRAGDLLEGDEILEFKIFKK